jgi:hypothetical protein
MDQLFQTIKQARRYEGVSMRYVRLPTAFCLPIVAFFSACSLHSNHDGEVGLYRTPDGGSYDDRIDASPKDGKITVDGQTIDTANGTIDKLRGDATIDTANVAMDTLCSDLTATIDSIVVGNEVVELASNPPATPENTVKVTNVDAGIVVTQNDAVMVFDQGTDGKIINGNILIIGSNVTVNGNGPDKTIINGDLTLVTNDAFVRGLRIKGSVLIVANDISLFCCVVEGDITVVQNDVIVAATDVFGGINVIGNDSVLVQDRVQGSWSIGGSGHLCDENAAFQDEDGDLLVDQSEIGNALQCQ